MARRYADRPHQLLELFGEHLRGAEDSGGVCADARDAPAPGTGPPRPGASLDLARTFLEAGCSGGGLGASHRVALAPVLSVPRYLSSSRLELGRATRVALPPSATETHLCHPLTRGVSLRVKNPTMN